MAIGFIVFLGLSLFGLHWYLKGSALSREKELRRSLEFCLTLDEQYKITREMCRRNLEVPNVLPPLLHSDNGKGVMKQTGDTQHERRIKDEI